MPKPEAKRHPKTILHPFSSSVLRGGIGFAPKAALGADASGLMADRPPSAEAGVGARGSAIELLGFTRKNG